MELLRLFEQGSLEALLPSPQAEEQPSLHARQDASEPPPQLPPSARPLPLQSAAVWLVVPSAVQPAVALRPDPWAAWRVAGWSRHSSLAFNT